MQRQVDSAVYLRGHDRPMLVVECKRYARRLHVKDVETFIAMLDDLGAERGVLVAPLGFSPAAERRAPPSKLVLHRLPERDAVTLNWRELARFSYPWDEGFHPRMGDAFDALLTDENAGVCLDALDELPFEEWEATLTGLFRQSRVKTTSLLATIAECHHDSAWRFNAIRLLDEFGVLEDEFASHLLAQEADQETIELLRTLCHQDIGA